MNEIPIKVVAIKESEEAEENIQMKITRNWMEKRERGQPIEYEKSNKHEKVNGMVKWNYLGHRRTVDPNKVKGMAKKDRQQRESSLHM